MSISKIPICRGSISGPYIISVDPVIPFGFAQGRLCQRLFSNTPQPKPDSVYDIRKPQYAVREIPLVWPPVAAYNLYGVDFPIFEPDAKALRRARHLRDTDGDGVCAEGTALCD